MQTPFHSERRLLKNSQKTTLRSLKRRVAYYNRPPVDMLHLFSVSFTPSRCLHIGGYTSRRHQSRLKPNRVKWLECTAAAAPYSAVGSEIRIFSYLKQPLLFHLDQPILMANPHCSYALSKVQKDNS